jgi:hypothetical protein
MRNSALHCKLTCHRCPWKGVLENRGSVDPTTYRLILSQYYSLNELPEVPYPDLLWKHRGHHSQLRGFHPILEGKLLRSDHHLLEPQFVLRFRR